MGAFARLGGMLWWQGRGFGLILGDFAILIPTSEQIREHLLSKNIRNNSNLLHLELQPVN